MVLTVIVALFCGSIFGTVTTLALTLRSFNRGYDMGVDESPLHYIVDYDHGYAEGLRDGGASPTSKNTKSYYDQGYTEGWQDCSREYGKIGKILADNADLDEIMVIRYDDQLPHRYKRVIVD